ncbi:MAG: DUF5615 family PIN-like protein [Patescibacteria group bacterium]
MKLFFDENVPKIIIDHFRSLHIDLKTVYELQLTQAPDQEIVKKSNTLRRTLVTRDLGLIRITSYEDATRFGLILIRYSGNVSQRLLNVFSKFVRHWRNKTLKDTLVILNQDKYEVFKGKFHEHS